MLPTLIFGGTILFGRTLAKRNAKFSETKELSASSGDDAVCSLPTPAQTLKLVETRRSIFTKQYTGRSVNREIVKEMLDAARYAPNHHITEPWRFIIFESPESKQNVALLLAEMYKKKSRSQGSFKQAKYDKKIKSASKASHIVAICVKTDTKSMLMEEVCATAMAVQNMHLVATAYHVGAYWSSGGVSESTLPPGFQNAPEMAEFLSQSSPHFDGNTTVCLGWFFIGDCGDATWPAGRRRPIEEKISWA